MPVTDENRSFVAMPFPWGKTGDGLQIAFQGSRMQVRLRSQGRQILDGDWEFALRFSDRTVSAAGDWEEVCRYEDGDADYLELELSLSSGHRLQRQLLVAKRDTFVWFADAILASKPGSLEFVGRWRAAPAVTLVEERESRECQLRSNARAATLIPPALPEWRAEPCSGSLRPDESGFVITHQATAERLYVPLFLDLNPKRFRRPLTWRRLTVAESLVAQPADVAVGYRLQIGTEQWLIYRSLAPCANRSVLGHNLATEFLCGRFGRDGVVEKIMEVIGPEESTEGSSSSRV